MADEDGSRRWKAWAGDVATQAIGQALGTLLAAGVVVLAGAAFGLVHGLGTTDVIIIVLALTTAAVLLIILAKMYRDLTEAQGARIAEALEVLSQQRELDRRAEEFLRTIDETQKRERERNEEERRSE